MRRRGLPVLQVVISAAVVTALFWPMADYKWTLFSVRDYDPVTGAHPVYVSAPVADITVPIAHHTWWLFVGLPEVILGALLAIGAFVLLGRLFGCSNRYETLCRSCGQVLIGLSEPQCPTCGEHL